MEINADFAQRIMLHGDAMAWTPSPTAGVDRRMLDRIGGEVARATSFVRYAPGSRFPPHVHDGGEEFIVIDGVFQDEHGDYPPGTYVRNPPTTRHRPGSASGCVIFVKLWQFDPADRMTVTIDTQRPGSVEAPGRPGVSVLPLFDDVRESVRIETWAPGAAVAIDAPHGLELLMLEGACVESGDRLRALSWLRIPAGGRLAAQAGGDGARAWIKTGGLRFLDPPLGGHAPEYYGAGTDI